MKEGIYLFCGEEDFLKEEASKKLISTILPPQSQRLNCDTYNAKDNYREISDTINTLPLFSDKKIVIIKNIECLPESKKDLFLSYLKHPHKQIYLILQSDETTLSDKFIKSISHYAKTYQFKKMDKRETRDWIYRRLNKYKKDITKEAMDLLLELKGSNNLAILSEEVEKLVTYKDEERTVKEEDVIELVGKSITKRAFDLIEAIGSGDRDSALLLVRELTLGNRRGIPEIMGLMGWQLRRIWKAKSILPEKIGRRRFSIEELKRGLKLLVEADHRIKRGYNKPEFILEELVIKLCSS